MSIVTQWQVILAFLIAISCLVVDSKVFERCELAKILRERHKLDLEEVAQWVCIAQHSSGFNTDAQAYSPSGGSHGLFQISDVYWCSPPGRGAGCNLSCHKLRDDNINDDLSCLKRIYDEHQRISGDGYTAWTAYQHFCKNNAISYIQDCFSSQTKVSTYLTSAKEYHSYQAQYPANSIKDYSSKKHGKIYKRCELARELHNKHKMPMEQIPTWVCIVEHESRYNTAALGRSNTDDSTDYGLFQISDLYWCSPDRYSKDGDKACSLSCSKLLDDDITDDVHCVKRIHDEYTSTSGDGFTAWTAYKPYCQNQRYEQVANCFQNTQHYQQQKVQATAVIQSTNKFTFNSDNPFFKNILQQLPTKTYHTSPINNDIFKMSSTKTSISRRVPHKGKVYTRCTLAQELYFKYKFPIQDISTWVCIAQHQSQFNTAAVGQLNTDGSANYGLFQISDKYWCNHDTYGDKACSLSCDKLLDDDLLDDVQCIKIIHKEHTRISGDGFNAWTVYKSHCKSQNIEHIKSCFDKKTLASNVGNIQKPSHNFAVSKLKSKIYKKCELAQELYHKHHTPMEQIPTWVCIAQHESSFNTAAVGRLNNDGSADHGLFQISDIYWCTHDQYGGKACNIPCDKLLDSDITDDVRCIKIIYEEHTRISGDGFNAWAVYKPYCRNTGVNYVKDCFTEKELKQFNKTIHLFNSNSLVSQSSIGTKPLPKGKIYKKCELAQELYHKHHVTIEQIPTWVCIAQHESSFNTAAVGRLNSDGSADHGLFQISDIYWCTHDQYGGKACNIPCDKLLDSDITDDVRCIKIIYEEHTRISGDGFNAWAVYKPYCRNTGVNYVKDCFTEKELKQFNKTIHIANTNSLVSQTSTGTKPLPKGKIYKKCELAQELYHKHHTPMEQIPTWVCIAQHESSFNTAAVGRLNSDGSADHGLFQISDIYWCTHDQYGGKACNIPCDKLLDSDITDDVRCIKIIYEEHTRNSGDGFNAWAVYKPYCRNTGLDYIKNCFTEEELKEYKERNTAIIGNSIRPQHVKVMNVPKGKIYKKCELAQELLYKHKMPMEQIPTWVCIAEHESSFNTAAVGRLNTDGSLDHGLFQISDLYWCSHNQFGGKACNIPCDKLLDSDITDDIRCVQVIHEEHTHISGDGFNAWTVYKPHCRNRKMEDIRTCFSSKQIEEFEKKQIFAYKISDYRPLSHTSQKNSYNNNPFLAGLKLQSKQISQKQTYNQNSILISKNQKLNYTNNPFLQNVKMPTSTEEFKITTNTANDFITASKKDYKLNPFLNGSIKLSTATLPNYKQKHNKSKPTYNQNPFLKDILASLANNNITPKPAKVIQNYPVKANILPSENIKLSSSVQPTQSSPQYTKFYETTSVYKSENKKSYLNSNDLRTTATVKPKTTTTARTTSWTTTNKPTILSNTYTTTKRPTTITTQMATITLGSITKKLTTSPKVIISSWQHQNFAQTTTSLNWQSPKYYHTTTTKPLQNTTTIKWNWQSQKYKNNVTIPQAAKNVNSYKLPSTTPRTERTTTNLRNEPTLKSNWKNKQHVKTTTKLSPKQTSTTIKPTTTITNWQKNNKTTTTSTTRKYNTTTNTRKPTTKTILSRWNTTVKSITASTIKSSTNTTKPIPLDNQKSSTSKLHNNRTLYNEKIKTTTARPWTTIIRTTLKKPLNTTTQKPLTTKSQTIVDYEKYKNDPFSHPFFAKVNEQIKQLRGNTTTIELPSFKATKLQSFPQSPLYQDFKNSITNKTKTVISYNFEDSKLSSTKRPKL